MRLKIAICEDNKKDCTILKSMLDTFLNNHDIRAELTLFSSGEDFLTVHSKKPFDIVFMDIYLSGLNGLDAVSSARSQNPVHSVFTTTSHEHAIEAFNLNASHYLIKPLTYEAVTEAMERCLSKIGTYHSSRLDIKTPRGIISVPTENIVYIEVFNKVCMVHTEKNSFQTYSSLDALFEHLNNHTFMRAQRSFIVNMNFIESFYFDHIILSNGKSIVLSRNNRAELKDQYQQFLFRLARREGF